MTRGKGNTEQGEQTPQANASDDRGGDVKILKSLNQRLLIIISNERKQIDELKNTLQLSEDTFKEWYEKKNEDKSQLGLCEEAMKNTIEKLKNELIQTRILSDYREKLCIQLGTENDELKINLKECNDKIKELQFLKTELDQTRILSESQERLCTKLVHERDELAKKLNEWNDEIQELQSFKNELNQTRILYARDEKLCSQLREENIKLENKVNECKKMIEESQVKMNRDRLLWNSYKADMQGEILELQNKFESALNEKKVLNQKHEELRAKHRNYENQLKKCKEGAEKFKTKMVEFKKSWDPSRPNVEGKITRQRSQIDEAGKFNINLKDTKELLKEKLRVFDYKSIELQNELSKVNFLFQKHHKQCTVSREQNGDLHIKLKECDGRIEELIARLGLWDNCNEKLEGKVEGLLDGKRIMSQEYDENFMLEQKLNECNDRNNKLHAKINKDLHLWVGLQNELDLMIKEGSILSQKYVELYSECAFLKAHMGVYNEEISSVEDERLGLTFLLESKSKKLKCLQTKVQLMSTEQKELDQQVKKLLRENELLKEKVENYDQKLDLVTRENGSLKKEMYELQIKLCMWADEEKQNKLSYADTLEEMRQFLTPPSTRFANLVEDVVTETRSVKQEVLRLNEQNQVLENEILEHKSLLQTQAGIVSDMNAENNKLQKELEELRKNYQGTEENNTRAIQERGALWENLVQFREIAKQREETRRDSCREHIAFRANFMCPILLDRQSRESKCYGTKYIIVPPTGLLSACPDVWCRGII